MTEAPLNPRTNRAQLAERLFESMRVPALFCSPPAVLSLYASGRTTGIVLDIGEGVTHAIPVYEGFALPHSVQRSDVAGRAVTDRFQRLLRTTAGLCLTTTAEADLVQKMKHDLCYVTTPDNTTSSAAQQEKEAVCEYQLPDGQTITVGSERYQATDLLFDPSLIGSEEMGIADVLTTAIALSDLELRSKLYSQVVLAGGTTLLPGLGDRLLYEVRQRAPAATSIRIAAPPDRLTTAWTGGSILASLATFRSMWVSRAEYEEHGSNILYRREL